jgi:hypothetical protein
MTGAKLVRHHESHHHNFNFRYFPFPCAQRLALPAAGGTRLAHETDKTQRHEQSQFDGANPAVRVHAVLGAHDKERISLTTLVVEFCYYL